MNLRRNKYTPIQIELIRKMLADKISVVEISKRIGHPLSSLYTYMSRQRMTTKTPKMPWTTSEVKRLTKYRASNMRITEISKRLNRTYSSVAAKIYNMGI